MFLKTTLPILKMFFGLFGIVFVVIAVIILPFFISAAFWFCYFRFVKKVKPKRRTYAVTTKNRNFFLRLFVDFPKRFIHDRLLRDPDEFDLYGLWCFVGQQGSGKSIALVEMLRSIKSKFPRCKILSNIDITFSDQLITDPADFVFNDNGGDGMVVVLDEAQNWFNSAESRNFPPEVLQEICQERKQHKMIAMTTQRFNRLSAALREQIDYYVKPFTVAGCLTVVRVYTPSIKEFEAEIVKLKRIKTYFFVHDDVIRGSFDTRAKVKRLTLKGWKPRSEQLTADPVDVVTSKLKGKTPKP